MIAYIFPGQGSQYPGMGRELAENFKHAREVFEKADDALGFSLSQLCFAGLADELQLTENTQPAILTASIAALRVLEAEGFTTPDFVAGHSLGEYSALVAAGSLEFAAAVKLVRARGRYMQGAVPVGVGAMAAIIGLDLDQVAQVCAEVRGGQVCGLANINSPTQIVIAGHAEAVDKAVERLKEQGARRAVKLSVSAPFHCELMQPAEDRLAIDLDQTEFRNLRVPIATNVDAALVQRGSEARDCVRRQVSRTVRWLETIELLLEQGVTAFVEIGPGKVLSGLVRHTARSARCFNIEDIKSLNAARHALHVQSVNQT